MSAPARLVLTGLLAALGFSQTACNLVPQQSLRQAQFRAWELHQQNVGLAFDRDQAAQLAEAEAARAQQLARQNSDLENSLLTANQRLENLMAERSQLHQRLVSTTNPLPDSANERFRKLQQKYPQFEFDPTTGVSKFSDDLLFDTGSDAIKPAAVRVLEEFAQIMNDGEARQLNILVVGHTDDQRIAKSATAQKHPTNWHLSTNRANAVVLALSRAGLTQGRMGAAGYSMYQPVTPNKDNASRQKNRRVEIFVLAPDATVAGWDPATSRN
ncbi:MAG TPA: OmpA family protein [Planctomycetaceae bacterium]|nr:OmpA family protein [Planctomycetaceae bacterium]